ncbi:MAG: DUF2752 domain-containing protein [Planctomycetaceae bacterium]
MNCPSQAAAPSRPPVEPPPLPEAIEACRERRLAVGFALLGVAVLCVAAILDPYDAAGRPRTHGTHRQLGLPACTLKSLTGVGCPSCGMTTAFALLAHGDPAAAWRTNWAGCVAAALAAVGTAWFLLVAAGLPPGRLTADEVVKFMVAIGSAVAVVRWLAVLCGGALVAVW